MALPSDSVMSDLYELSGDEDLNDFNEDENTNIYNENPEHHSDTERFIINEIFYYHVMIDT